MAPRFRPLALALALLPAAMGLGIGVRPGPALAQSDPSPGPVAPAQPAPGAPPATLTQPPAGSPAPQSAPSSAAANQPLVPKPGDTADVDEVILPAKPVAIMSGQSKWDDGFKTMRASFQHIREELGRAGIAVAGRPLTLFVETNDETFKFEAMIPVESAPATTANLPPEIRFGVTPSGKAFRFVHKGPYDEIDATYETITAYLDAKDIPAKDAFLEEYLNDVGEPADAALELNIFVQPQ